MRVVGVDKKGWTFHDFPHRSRRCPHLWIINVTPPGRPHCVHNCPFCYARWAVYSDRSWDGPFRFYKNITEVVRGELDTYQIVPPVYLSSVTDVCQRVDPLRREVERLISLLLERNVSFTVTTKGDPGFIVDAVKGAGFKRFVLQVSIEGPEEVVRLTSPGALSYRERLEVVRYASSLSVPVLVRLDPFFYHIYLGLFGTEWKKVVHRLMMDFKKHGAFAVVGSTGRFSGKTFVDEKGEEVGCDFEGYVDLCESLGVPGGIVRREHEKALRRGVKGVFLREDILRLFHMVASSAARAVSIRYQACDIGDDSCDVLSLPMVFRAGKGFRPIPGCSARCWVCSMNHRICSHLKTVDGPLKRTHLMGRLSPIERFIMGDLA